MLHIPIVESSNGNISGETICSINTDKNHLLISEADSATLSHLFEKIVNGFLLLSQIPPS